jgi:hypothetical protein
MVRLSSRTSAASAGIYDMLPVTGHWHVTADPDTSSLCSRVRNDSLVAQSCPTVRLSDRPTVRLSSAGMFPPRERIWEP